MKRCPPAAPPRAPRRAARPAPAVRRGGRRRGGRENCPCARPAVASGRRGQERAEGSGGPVRARPAAQRSARALSDSAPPPRLPHLATTQSGVSSPNRRGRPVHLLARRAQPQQLRQRPAPVAAGRVRLGEQARHLQALFSYLKVLLLLLLSLLCASESRAATYWNRRYYSATVPITIVRLGEQGRHRRHSAARAPRLAPAGARLAAVAVARVVQREGERAVLGRGGGGQGREPTC